jgi:hypothetical protein
MKKYIIDENKLRKAIRHYILEQESQQEPKEQQQRCLTTNTVSLDEIVGLNDGFKNYTSKLYKRSGGIRGMVDALDILRTLRLHPDVQDSGEHLSYDLMNHLNTFRGKNYLDETTGDCHSAMDKVIELYKENEHGEELVRDIEKVLAHPDPSSRAKEYLKRCLTLVKEK